MTDDTPASTTVFQSGNSQAVRLPKAFRFNTKTVEIFRRGDEVVLREKRRSFAQALDEALIDLPPLSDDDVVQLDKAMHLAKDRRAAEERDWSLLSDAEPNPASAAAPKRGTKPTSPPAPKPARKAGRSARR